MHRGADGGRAGFVRLLCGRWVARIHQRPRNETQLQRGPLFLPVLAARKIQKLKGDVPIIMYMAERYNKMHRVWLPMTMQLSHFTNVRSDATAMRVFINETIPLTGTFRLLHKTTKQGKHNFRVVCELTKP